MQRTSRLHDGLYICGFFRLSTGTVSKAAAIFASSFTRLCTFLLFLVSSSSLTLERRGGIEFNIVERLCVHKLPGSAYYELGLVVSRLLKHLPVLEPGVARKKS
jgi:hypothetical protein